VADFCEYGNGLSDLINVMEFLDQMNDYLLIKMGSASLS
jgi:hypothetical protein